MLICYCFQCSRPFGPYDSFHGGADSRIIKFLSRHEEWREKEYKLDSKTSHVKRKDERINICSSLSKSVNSTNTQEITINRRDEQFNTSDHIHLNHEEIISTRES